MQCVVGANGFLGSALARHLEAGGVAPHHFTRADTWFADSGEVNAALRGTDVVYWLAGSVNPATADSRPDSIEADLAGLHVFAAAVRELGVRRVVLAGSGGTVYDVGAPPPYNELSATHPLSTYGNYKLQQERLLAAALPPDVELVVLRVSNAYGPGQPVGTGQGVVAYWLDAAANNRPLVLFGEHSTTRDFTYIDDVAAALAHFGSAPVESAREVFNIGSGAATELGELAATILSALGDPSLRLEMQPARPFDVPHLWLNCSRAAAAGWRASTDLTEGVERSWRALRQSRAGV